MTHKLHYVVALEVFTQKVRTICILDYFLRLLVANYSALYCQYCSLSICQMCFPLLLHGIWKRKKCSTNITSILQDNDGFDFSCFSASLPYLNIYFAMPCTMYLLSRHTFVKQENNYCCRSLSQSRIFCFCNCSVLYSGPARVRNGNVIVFSENKNCIYVESTISENYNENIKMKIK